MKAELICEIESTFSVSVEYFLNNLKKTCEDFLKNNIFNEAQINNIS